MTINQIYADVNEDDDAGEPNFQWVVLASDYHDELTTLTVERDEVLTAALAEIKAIEPLPLSLVRRIESVLFPQAATNEPD